MILDNEKILEENIISHVNTQLLNKYLGKLYITKSGLLGFILDIDKNHKPSVIMRCSSTRVSYDIYTELKNISSSNDVWELASKDKIMKYLKNWDVNNQDRCILLNSLCTNSRETAQQYNHVLINKCQPGYIDNISDKYWLADESNYTINIVNFGLDSNDNKYKIEFIQAAAILKSSIKNMNYKVLFLKELNEDEKYSLEESDVIINQKLLDLDNICSRL